MLNYITAILGAAYINFIPFMVYAVPLCTLLVLYVEKKYGVMQLSDNGMEYVGAGFIASFTVYLLTITIELLWPLLLIVAFIILMSPRIDKSKQS